MQVDGDYQYNARSNQLTWTVDLIDSANRSGALEFVVPVASSDAFFPVDVSFSAAHTLCQVRLEQRICQHVVAVHVVKMLTCKRMSFAGCAPPCTDSAPPVTC